MKTDCIYLRSSCSLQRLKCTDAPKYCSKIIKCRCYQSKAVCLHCVVEKVSTVPCVVSKAARLILSTAPWSSGDSVCQKPDIFWWVRRVYWSISGGKLPFWCVNMNKSSHFGSVSMCAVIALLSTTVTAFLTVRVHAFFKISNFI